MLFGTKVFPNSYFSKINRARQWKERESRCVTHATRIQINFRSIRNIIFDGVNEEIVLVFLSKKLFLPLQPSITIDRRLKFFLGE